MDDPYRTSAPVDLGPRLSCDHDLGADNKAALGCLGGWWHSRECVDWHRRLAAAAPDDPRMAVFLATCNAQLRAKFEGGGA